MSAGTAAAMLAVVAVVLAALALLYGDLDTAAAVVLGSGVVAAYWLWERRRQR